MHPRASLPVALLDLAAERHGVLTRRELLDAGVSRHAVTRMARGWHTLAPGVFWIDPGADAWLARVHAGLLLGGPGAAAWGTTALALWDLADRPAVIEVLTPLHRLSPGPWLRFHRQGDRRRRIVPVTPHRVNLEDAAIDAAASADEVRALALVARVLQERRSTPDRLLEAVRRRSRVRHRRLLVAAIGSSAAGAHSALEHLFTANVLRPHHLPALVRQYVVPQSGHVADLASPRDDLLIELDGVRYHDRDADRVLDNLHASHGYRTLRFTWPEVVGAGCGVARTIADVLRSPLHPCVACAH